MKLKNSSTKYERMGYKMELVFSGRTAHLFSGDNVVSSVYGGSLENAMKALRKMSGLDIVETGVRTEVDNNLVVEVGITEENEEQIFSKAHRGVLEALRGRVFDYDSLRFALARFLTLEEIYWLENLYDEIEHEIVVEALEEYINEKELTEDLCDLYTTWDKLDYLERMSK